MSKGRPDVPATVECPECGRMVRTGGSGLRNFMTHSQYPTGPECPLSREPVTDDAIRNTHHRQRAQVVLHWAHILRDEDPRRVLRALKACDRRELETLMMIALAAIDPDRSEADTFGWVTKIGSLQ